MTLRLLSGGAAHGLVTALAPAFEAETGCRIEGKFGPVGARAAELRAGEPADLLILTAELIAELREEGYIAGNPADLGVVHTAVAVRSGDPLPPIGDADALRAALLAADEVHFPDPQQATAGIHFAKVLQDLGIADAAAPRLKTHPSGAAAMRALAASTGARPIGCTQATEILITPGVALVGSLPSGCDLATVYTAAVCTRAASPELAARFVALLAADAARESRRRAGFA